MHETQKCQKFYLRLIGFFIYFIKFHFEREGDREFFFNKIHFNVYAFLWFYVLKVDKLLQYGCMTLLGVQF